MKRVRSFLSCALLLVSAAVTAAAAEHRRVDARPDRNAMWQAMLTKQQTLAVSVAFDGEGRLWRARVQDGHVLVDRSDNEGASFGAPVTVNPDKEVVAAEGDSAPKIALAADGAIYVSYTQLLNKPFSGDIRFSRSHDGGKRFSAPVPVNDNRDVIGHRFDALIVGRDGKVYVVWLDKRDKAVAKQRGEEYAGAALYYAVSTDRGASFTANRKLADHTCECCRIALDLAPDGRPVAIWRHVFEGGERDHALMKFDGQSTPRRVTHDRWRIDACPHHGPALSIAADGHHHLAWFDNAPDARGLFYARSTDGGATRTCGRAEPRPRGVSGMEGIQRRGVGDTHASVKRCGRVVDGAAHAGGDRRQLRLSTTGRARRADVFIVEHRARRSSPFSIERCGTMKALALAMTMMCMAGIAEAMEPFVRGSQQAVVPAHGGRPFVLSLWSLDCVHCRPRR